MKKLARSIVRLVFNKIIFWPFIYFYDRVFNIHLQEAWGYYLKNKIPGCPSTSSLYGKSVLTQPENIKMGEYVRIGSGCYFFSNGGISIGDGTVISRNVVIYTSNHNVTGGNIPYDNSYVHKSVKIGRGVWIGMGVMITPGVEIGDGAVIGMGTVVSRNVEAGEFVVGARQRKVKERDVDFRVLIENNSYFSRYWP